MTERDESDFERLDDVAPEDYDGDEAQDNDDAIEGVEEPDDGEER